jgi:hypothetical protein
MRPCLLHFWTSWRTHVTTRDADFGTLLVVQAKDCRRCGKLKLRTVRA